MKNFPQFSPTTFSPVSLARKKGARSAGSARMSWKVCRDKSKIAIC